MTSLYGFNQRYTRLAACLFVVASIAAEPTRAQEKVPPPGTTRRAPELTMAQLSSCILIAKRISDLTDSMQIAKARGDTDEFNRMVDPYNSSQTEWNGTCTRPYEPANMVRAENQLGLRICKFTSSPCLTDAQRHEILVDEARRQNAADKKRPATAPASAPVAQIAGPTGTRSSQTGSPARPKPASAIDESPDTALRIHTSSLIAAISAHNIRYPVAPAKGSSDQAAAREFFNAVYDAGVRQRVAEEFPSASSQHAEALIARIQYGQRAAFLEVESFLQDLGLELTGERLTSYYNDGFAAAYARRLKMEQELR